MREKVVTRLLLQGKSIQIIEFALIFFYIIVVELIINHRSNLANLKEKDFYDFVWKL